MEYPLVRGPLFLFRRPPARRLYVRMSVDETIEEGHGSR